MDGNNYIFSSTAEARSCCESILAGATYYEGLVSELQSSRNEIVQNWEGDANDIASVLASIDDITSKFTTNNTAMRSLAESMISLADQTDSISSSDVNNSVTPDSITPDLGTSIVGSAQTKENGNSGGTGNVIGGTITGAGIGAGIGTVIAPGIGTAIGAGIGGIVGGVGSGFDSENTFENDFWSKHGNNFAEAWTTTDWTDNWDYSGCESVIDVVGQTADGLLGTVSDLGGALIDTVGAAGNFLIDGIGELFGGLF